MEKITNKEILSSITQLLSGMLSAKFHLNNDLISQVLQSEKDKSIIKKVEGDIIKTFDKYPEKKLTKQKLKELYDILASYDEFIDQETFQTIKLFIEPLTDEELENTNISQIILTNIIMMMSKNLHQRFQIFDDLKYIDNYIKSLKGVTDVEKIKKLMIYRSGLRSIVLYYVFPTIVSMEPTNKEKLSMLKKIALHSGYDFKNMNKEKKYIQDIIASAGKADLLKKIPIDSKQVSGFFDSIQKSFSKVSFPATSAEQKFDSIVKTFAIPKNREMIITMELLDILRAISSSVAFASIVNNKSTKE